MDTDWDLLAVVRGARSSTAATTTTSGGFQVEDLQQNLPPLPNLPAANYQGGCEDLQDLYKPFVPILKCPISAPSAFADGGLIREQLKLQERPQQQILFQQPPQVKDSHQLIFGSRGVAAACIIAPHTHRSNPLCAPTTTTTTPPTTTSLTHQRPKKRKNLQKKVCHVPVEGLSSDMWAWRKYGQKPIKGSPYPRGYYRCSSSKGCPARKQVERDRSSPKMFIVTYTSDHNHPMPTHRNSLAGSTRNKPSCDTTSAAAATATATAASPSPPSTGNEHPASLSPTASPSTDKGGEIKTEHDDDSGNEMEFFPDMVLDDDFFVGFEGLDDTDGGDVTRDQIQATPQLMVGVDFLDEQDWDLGFLHSTSSSS